MATDWSRLTVVDLRQELKRRGLPQTGKKADLVQRLVSAETDEASQTVDRSQESPSQNATSAETQNKLAEGRAPTPQPPESPPKVQTPELSKPSPPPVSTPPSPLPPVDAPPAAGLSSDGTGSDNMKIGLIASADEPPASTMNISQVASSRKRRSRSPPLDDELSRKRARPSDEDDKMETGMAGRTIVGGDVSYAIVEPAVSDADPQPDSRTSPRHDETDRPTQDDITAQTEERSGPFPQSDLQDHPRQTLKGKIDEDEYVDEQDRNVAPAEHRATSALYIRNFMRPLRESTLRDYLSEVAAPRGASPDPSVIEEFYLDQIRTHAFVRFCTTTAASRVRVALHGRVWPNERERKELWVDFIPAEVLSEWVDREQTEGGRGTRWEVRYDTDSTGDTTARLVTADADATRWPSRPEPPPPPPPSGPAASFTIGPSRSYAGVEGAPLGPRGRGGNAYRQQSFLGASAEFKETRAGPPLLYKPVPNELAERRIKNMRSFYTKDRHRTLGRPDEINRYTFEHQDAFVDRGKENFIGIRPPHREHERRRALAGGGYRGPRGARGFPPRGDRYLGGNRDDRYLGSRHDERSYGGGRDDRYSSRRDDHYSSGSRDRSYGDDRGGRDAPRSRLDGAQLPTFDISRYGGRGGGRRDDYWSGRR